jgi:hypothetical protein
MYLTSQKFSSAQDNPSVIAISSAGNPHIAAHIPSTTIYNSLL